MAHLKSHPIKSTTVSLGMTAAEPASPKRKFCEFGARTRYLILLIVTLCLSSIWSNILTFNFTVICMTPKNSTNGERGVPNGSHFHLQTGTRGAPMESEEKGEGRMMDEDSAFMPPFYNESHVTGNIDYDYSSATDDIDFTPTANQKSMLMGAVAVGALIAIIPLTDLINRIGPRLVFSAVGLLSAIATALVPAAIRFGFPYFLALRALQGVSFAACMPMIGAVTAHWATLKQNGIYLSILTGYLQLAPSMTMPISGELCVSSYGWPAVYYVHAYWTACCFFVFAFFYRNSPKKHPFVGQRELNNLAEGKIQTTTAATKKAQKKIPYAAIFKSMSVWAVWMAAIGNFAGTNLVMLFAPTYLNKAIGFPIARTGFSAALPPLVQFIVKLFSGLTSDKVHCLAETLKVRVYNSVAFLGMGFFFVALAFAPSNEPMVALIGLICATSILGFNTGGFYKSATLISRQYSHFVMGTASMMLSLTLLVVPLIVDCITEENTQEEWRIVFLIHACILIWTNAFFCYFGSAKPAPWTIRNKRVKFSAISYIGRL